MCKGTVSPPKTIEYKLFEGYIWKTGTLLHHEIE